LTYFFLNNALAASTTSAYQSGTRSYISFCQSYGLQPFPCTERSLCLFAVISARRLSYPSIKVYLCGIQHHSLLFGFPTQLFKMKYLYYIFRGIRRSQGNPLCSPPRQPITIEHLWLTDGFVSASAFSEGDKAMWRSATLAAFFGLLQVSEFTCPSQSFDLCVHLAVSNVTFKNDFTMLYLKIKASKTDPFHTGVIIRLTAINNHDLCSIQAMRRYLSHRGCSPRPLFVFSDGTFLTHGYLVAFLRMVLPDIENINTHSFRIGGASAAMAAGASDALIRIMGRWSSDCYNRYI